MPTIRIDFDNEKLSNDEILELSNATQKIVSEITGIADTFVYANSSQIKIKVAPIEIYIQLSAHKIKDQDELFESIKKRLSEWKKTKAFGYPINLTLIPMHWKFEVDI